MFGVVPRVTIEDELSESHVHTHQNWIIQATAVEDGEATVGKVP